MSRKAYVVGGDVSYCNWMEIDEIVDEVERANLIVWTGGSDVSTELYGATPHITTSTNPHRDKYELEIFNRVNELGIPSIGICRGNQWLGVMAGLKLVQHMNHEFRHPMRTLEGDEIFVSSSHHQRVYMGDAGDKATLLGWAEGLSPYSYGQDNSERLDEDKEAEVLCFGRMNAPMLGYQNHPEWFTDSNEDWAKQYIAYCRSLIPKYLEV